MWRPAFACTSFLAALCLGAPALAKAPLAIDVPSTLPSAPPANEYSSVVVRAGGVLRVPAVKPGTQAGGILHLRATRITVEEGGTISVTGAGFPGSDLSDGAGMGGGKVGTMQNQPGGGGSFMGAGNRGSDAGCSVVLGGSGDGGATYGDAMTALLGSAGGAAMVSEPGIGSLGGAGGGIVVLEANVVEIFGRVEANGAPGGTSQEVGSGGGSGGSVHIRAFRLELGPNAVIAAAGGAGGIGGKGYGGGGGGGLILLEAPASAGSFDISGGVSGTCPADPVAGAGASGEITLLPAPEGCFDLDGDGVVACGPGCPAVCDCDDVDASILPGAQDRCDGIDNDCSGAPDDRPEDLCPEGSRCVEEAGTGSAVCVFAEDGGAPPPPTVAAPREIDYAGGCDMHRTTRRGSMGALVMMSLLALARRRTRQAR